jgi:glucose-1-phosphate cytidylyltransferase
MKAVILAGGLGTRISEETHLKPKPMIEIGGRPVLWHILKIYSAHGINDFVICAGYKGYVIKEYFANYFMHMSDVTFDMVQNTMEVHRKKAEPWRVTIVDTGESTMTGGRLARVASHLDGDEFCFTYGDGVTDLDVSAVLRYHKAHGKLATLTAVQPPGRYGALTFYSDDQNAISRFQEKPNGDGAWINGGFFVLNRKVIEHLKMEDHTVWEHGPMEQLAAENQLVAYKHKGFWRPMDTLRDKMDLESLWSQGLAPWKVWS